MAQDRTKPRRKTTEKGVKAQILTGGRPRNPQPGEVGDKPKRGRGRSAWSLTGEKMWEEIETRAGHGASAEDLTEAFELAADDETQGRLQAIVKRGNARNKLLLYETTHRKATRIGKEQSVQALKHGLQLFCGLEADGGEAPSEMPQLGDLKASIEAAIEAVKAKE